VGVWATGRVEKVVQPYQSTTLKVRVEEIDFVRAEPSVRHGLSEVKKVREESVRVIGNHELCSLERRRLAHVVPVMVGDGARWTRSSGCERMLCSLERRQLAHVVSVMGGWGRDAG
jgi:hypothetical protein